MDYRKLTEQRDYGRLRIEMAGAEGLPARFQDVGDGMITTGYGDTGNRRRQASYRQAKPRSQQ